MGYGWIIVFLLVLLLGCGYVSWHVWQILPLAVVGKWIVVGALLLCIVCFFTNFILGLDNKPMPIAITLYEVGNSAVFVGLYLLLLFLVLDLGRLLHLVPRSFLYNSWAGTLSGSCYYDWIVRLWIFQLFTQRACTLNFAVGKTDETATSFGNDDRPTFRLS